MASAVNAANNLKWSINKPVSVTVHHHFDTDASCSFIQVVDRVPLYKYYPLILKSGTNVRRQKRKGTGKWRYRFQAMYDSLWKTQRRVLLFTALRHDIWILMLNNDVVCILWGTNKDSLEKKIVNLTNSTLFLEKKQGFSLPFCALAFWKSPLLHSR